MEDTGREIGERQLGRIKTHKKKQTQLPPVAKGTIPNRRRV